MSNLDSLLCELIKTPDDLDETSLRCIVMHITLRLKLCIKSKVGILNYLLKKDLQTAYVQIKSRFLKILISEIIFIKNF